MIKTFTDLIVYQEAMELAKLVCEALKKIPKDERELISQPKRCCRSIPAQIAEGYGRKYSEKEFKKYLNNAAAECNEMITHVVFIKQEKYWAQDFSDEIINRYVILGKRIASLSKTWKNYQSNF